MIVGRVDDNVDLAADFTGKIAHRAAVGHVQRYNRSLRQFAQCRQAGIFLPRFCLADPNQIRAGGRQGAYDRLPQRRLAIGHQRFAETGIAGHLTQLGIFRQLVPPLLGNRDEGRLPRPVERCFDTNPARRRADTGVDVGDHIDAGVQPNDADAPGQTLAEE